MSKPFEAAHERYIQQHLEARSGERRGRLERGHQYAEKLFLRTIWWPLLGRFDDLHPEYEVQDWNRRSQFLDFVFLPRAEPRFFSDRHGLENAAFLFRRYPGPLRLLSPQSARRAEQPCAAQPAAPDLGRDVYVQIRDDRQLPGGFAALVSARPRQAAA